MSTVLRPYQSEIVRGVSSAYKEKQQGVLMQMGTGLGKTRTAAYIVEKYSSTGRQVLWLVHRDELLMQAAMTFAENGISHRLVCAADSERAIKVEEFREFGRSFVNRDALVVVASIQTIVRRLDKLEWLNPSQIVADECHLSLAASWRRVLSHWPEARLLGLTATPTRLDKQSFARAEGGLYDVMVRGPSNEAAIQMGALSDFVVYAPPIRFKTGVKMKTKGGDYDPKSLEAEFENPVIFGDVVEHYRRYSHGKPAIGFCPTVKVAEDFAQKFREAGYRAIALDGTTDDRIRRQTLKDLAVGKVDVIMSVNILVEGTDVPYATTAIWLRRTKSLVIYLQGSGRVLRPHPDKERAIILDFVGVTQTHGYPDDDREWSLSGEVKRKSKAKDGADVAVATCPDCYCIHPPAPLCPMCGHVYQGREIKQMEQIHGDLVIKTREDREKERALADIEKKRKQIARKREESDCVTYEDWVALAESRGYAFPAAWARRRYDLRVKRGQVSAPANA